MKKRVRHGGLAAMVLLGPVLLGGCDECKAPPAAAGAPGDAGRPGRVAARRDAGVPGRAVAAAERAIRAGLPTVKEMQFRGVQVYTQAAAHRWAVCGQVSPFADDLALFVPFVSVVSVAGDGSMKPDPAFIGSSVSEADRTYLALVTHCYDEGGPVDGPMAGVPPIPPLPNTVPSPSLESAGPVAAGPAVPGVQALPGAVPGVAGAGGAVDGSAAQPASGSITMRQNANVHASPHGASVRVVPQGTALRIFGQAPGGWYEVGDTAPWGWVHESMFSRQ